MAAAPLTAPALEIVASRVPDRESGKQAGHGSGSRFFAFKQFGNQSLCTMLEGRLCGLGLRVGLPLKGVEVWEFRSSGFGGFKG